MCLAPKTRPATTTKPARTLRWLSHVGYALGVLELAAGGRADAYSVEPIHNDAGVLGVRFLKADGAVYDVGIDGRGATCTCPGGTYRGHCKHADAVAALAARGAL